MLQRHRQLQYKYNSYNSEFLFQKVFLKSKFKSVYKSYKIPLVFSWWRDSDVSSTLEFLSCFNGDVRFTLDFLSCSKGNDLSPYGKGNAGQLTNEVLRGPKNIKKKASNTNTIQDHPYQEHGSATVGCRNYKENAKQNLETQHDEYKDGQGHVATRESCKHTECNEHHCIQSDLDTSNDLATCQVVGAATIFCYFCHPKNIMN